MKMGNKFVLGRGEGETRRRRQRREDCMKTKEKDIFARERGG